MALHLLVRRVRPGSALPLPARRSEGAAGFDLCADLEAPLVIQPMERVLVPTGFAVEVPPGHEVQIRARSGLAWTEGLTVLNGPGTIDSDYRGEVKVLLVHLGQRPIVIEPAQRIAQAVVAVVPDVVVVERADLSESGRGAGGFGSTGTR